MKKNLYLFVMILITSSIVYAGGAAEAPVVEDGKIGGTVNLLAVWGGQELEAFNEMIKPFEESTGIKVIYEGTRDIDAVLTTRVEAGNPPDLAGLPGPGKMAEFARAGKLVDLASIMDMDQVRADYAQGWLDLGSVDGTMVGVFIKSAIKGLVWYSPKEMEAAGLEIPATWDDLMEMSRKIAASGKAPWAIGLESGAASGWAGTDWLEDIFLRMYGPEKYKEWYEGKLAWTSQEVKSVWEKWGEIVADESMIYGGSQYVLSKAFGQSPAPLYETPAKAYFHHQASFIQSFILDMFPSLVPAEDFNFFGFPAINPEYANSVEAGGDLVGVFNDTPQSRAFINYLASVQAQSYWVSGAGALSANRNVSLVFYPDQLSKNAAKLLSSADMVVFDASDMMPGEMNTAFWSAVMDYVENPANLDSILEDLDKVRAEAY